LENKPFDERKGKRMKTKRLHFVTLGTILALTGAPYALAMDHSKMDHSAMGHGTATAATAPPAAEKPASASLEIRTAVVNGYTLTYTLIDTRKMMAASSTPMTHDMTKMKSHHLMVNPVAPDRKPPTGGKAGYLVVQPDKVEVKAMAMLMEGGFGADLDFVVKGDYRITTKIALADTTLVDEFVYSVK
jgi:hypothetical protein